MNILSIKYRKLIKKASQFKGYSPTKHTQADNKRSGRKLMLSLKVKVVRLVLNLWGSGDYSLGRGKGISIRNHVNEGLKLGMCVV